MQEKETTFDLLFSSLISAQQSLLAIQLQSLSQFTTDNKTFIYEKMYEDM